MEQHFTSLEFVMNRFLKLFVISVVGVVSFASQAANKEYPCHYSIFGSGYNSGDDPKPGTVSLAGKGTKDHPFELYYHATKTIGARGITTNIAAVCDITLTKKTKETKDENGVVTNRNLAYPEDRIYFRYHYKHLPLIDDQNVKVNGLTVLIAMDKDSSMTPSQIEDKHFNEPYISGLNLHHTGGTIIHKCPILFDFKRTEKYGFNEYSAACPYILSESSSDTISGSFRFFISLQGRERIKRFVDKKGNKHGAATIRIDWIYAPQNHNDTPKTNFNS